MSMTGSNWKRIEGWARQHQEALLGAAILLGALLLRKSLIYFVGNADYNCCLKPWYDYILDNGGIRALADNFSNYPPLYLLMLAGSAAIFGDSGYKPYAIKGIPIFFDLVGAFFVYKIVQLKYPQGRQPLWAAAAFLFLPSIFIVSGYWGQNDMLYIAGLLACVYFLMVDKEMWAFVALGWSLAIKLQAVFILPFLALLWLRGRVSLWSFLWVPAIYLLGSLPAILVGRPLDEVLLLYFEQAQLFPELTLNAPSIYAWLQAWLPEAAAIPGALAALLLLGGLAWWGARRLPNLDADILVTLAFASALLTPFLLPKMHERYFLAADAFAIVFAFYKPRYFYIPVVLTVVSVLAYIPFLFRGVLVPIESLAFFTLGAILVVMLELKASVAEPPAKSLGGEIA